MTKVINLLGGPNTGKSSIAALIFGELKLLGYNAELVREVAKDFAWQGIKPNAYDQVYIFGKQAKSEYSLYNKVDYIVTDSPLALCPIYEKFYGNNPLTIELLKNVLTKQKSDGIIGLNFLLTRKGFYEDVGRFQTESEAKQIDSMVEQFLQQNQMPYVVIDCPIRQRVSEIIYLAIKS